MLQCSQAHLPFSSFPATSFALPWHRGVTVERAPTSRRLDERCELLANRLEDADHRVRKSVTKPKFPTDRELVWAVLDVLKDRRGGPVPTPGIPPLVARKLSLPPEVVDWPHGTGTETELYYRVRWILKKLKDIGAVDNVERGYWSLTKTREEFRYRGDLYGTLIAQYGPEIVFERNESRRESKQFPLNRLRGMDRNSFENICREFLVKAGFLLINVTKQTPHGFEGTGTLRINLISFRVIFRCQNSAEYIDYAKIRAFRQSIAGRAEKGLFITTNSFGKSAIREANRDIVPALDLINGTELCDHLESLGVRV